MRLTALTYSGLYEYEYWSAGAIRKKTEITLNRPLQRSAFLLRSLKFPRYV